ncbi:MAG: alpha/beta hydrolase [Bacteroidales bacterium]|jgi:acetyl esterase/lipase|nr:alpha/beta hydrolase [Bacteroidales bacterium]
MKRISIITALLMIILNIHGIANTRKVQKTVTEQRVEYRTIKNISYISPSDTDSYKIERCKLDIYYPRGQKGFSTIVWYHGGGMTGGSKYFPKELMNPGIAIVSVNYRLSPRAKHPAYIYDAAEAIAWTLKNIKKYGGDPSKVYVSGHSAGGYLALMVSLDPKYMERFGTSPSELAGSFPISGQTLTHFTIRKEYGGDMNIPMADDYAPIKHINTEIPPIVLITGDRKLEMTARYEENALLQAYLKSEGNDAKLYELKGFSHGTVVDPACILIREIITGKAK